MREVWKEFNLKIRNDLKLPCIWRNFMPGKFFFNRWGRVLKRNMHSFPYKDTIFKWYAIIFINVFSKCSTTLSGFRFLCNTFWGVPDSRSNTWYEKCVRFCVDPYLQKKDAIRMLIACCSRAVRMLFEFETFPLWKSNILIVKPKYFCLKKSFYFISNRRTLRKPFERKEFMEILLRCPGEGSNR